MDGIFLSGAVVLIMSLSNKRGRGKGWEELKTGILAVTRGAGRRCSDIIRTGMKSDLCSKTLIFAGFLTGVLTSPPEY